MKQIKAAIFDLDGTLINSLTDIALSMNKALEVFKYPTHEEKAYIDFIGSGAKHLAACAMPEEKRQNDADVEELLSVYKEIYDKHYLDNTAPYPDIEKMLKHLSREIPVCVLSNKPDKATKELVEFIFKDINFTYVYGQREGIPKKPDPFVVVEIAKELGLSPDEILYAGDSGVDMQTGRAAKMITMGVLWGFRGREELELNGAEHLVCCADEIIEFYEALKNTAER